MNIAQMKLEIALATTANIPLMLWGPPGVGKSQGVEQWCLENNYLFIDVRLSQKDAVDLLGIPYRDPDTDRTHWAVPSTWPTDNVDTIIMFDEINHGTQATLSAAFQAIQERRIGDYFFPDKVRFIAAGNEAKHRTYANQMPSALRNRFGHIEVTSSEDDMCDYANAQGWSPLITGFFRFSPPSINEFEQHSESEEEKKRVSLVRTHNAFGTPRSWDAVNRLLTAAKGDINRAKHLIIGTVGQELAAKFMGYAEYYKDLPDLNKLIKAPNDFNVPENPGMQYAICSGLAAKADMKNIKNIIKYVIRLPAEFQATCVKDALSRQPMIGGTTAFAEWAEKNEDILF